jgi:hypothetical protein
MGLLDSGDRPKPHDFPPPQPHPLPLDAEHEGFDGFPTDEEFSALQAQLCPPFAYCYGLGSRMWYEIAVSRIEEVQWQKEAIHQLVLEQETKEMLIGLVKQHQVNKERVLSDIIPSKGKVSAPIGQSASS